MDANEIVLEIREGIQIFSLEPLRDGFADDLLIRPATRILTYANKAYRKLTEKGIYQCWHQLIMTAGKASYRASGKYTLVHDMYLLDPDTGMTSIVEEESVPRQSNLSDTWRTNTVDGKPDRVAFTGNMLLFNRRPDKVYYYYLLGDTVPAPLLLRTDTPKALDEQYHDAVVVGGMYEMARMALARQEAQTQGQLMRFQEIKEEWLDRQAKVEEVQVSRFTPHSSGAMVSDYRGQFARRS